MGMKEKVKTAVDGNGTVGRLLGSKKKKAAAAGILAAVIIALAAAILLNTNKDLQRKDDVFVKTMHKVRSITPKMTFSLILIVLPY